MGWARSRIILAVLAALVLASGAGAASAAERYVVQPGDTVAAIAAEYGISPRDIITANGIADVENVLVGTALAIPVGDVGVSRPPTSPEGVFVPGVPSYRQSRSLSCEYASMFIATSAFGSPIYETDYLWATPQSSNPHFGFRGNIDGVWGNTTDYGIYAEALLPTLNAFGFQGEITYSPDAATLRWQIDQGRPTVVWLSLWGDPGYYETDESGTYKLVPGYHNVVVYGYDDGGVYVSDPGVGAFQYFQWGWFLEMWSVMDGMALAVYPA